jgi:tetratricopeptide (TPR) repeat protein
MAGMKRPQFASQGSLNRMLQAVTEAWQRRDFQSAIESFERASRADPANVGLLLDLGGVYVKRWNIVAAERCFEKAFRLSPKKAEALAYAGQKCRDMGNFELGRIYLERALEQKEVSADACVQLAEIYERLRRLDDAGGMVERALRLNPAGAPALLAQARLHYLAGRLEEAERVLRTLLTGAEPKVRVRAWYELGAILDRQRRYDEAMTAFLEAKKLLRPDAARPAAELAIIRARVKELAANASTEILQRWFDQRESPGPPRKLALLGGHPRSGTTLLEQVLDSHPQIVSAEETELFLDEAYMPLTRSSTPDAPMLPVLEAAPTGALQKSRADYFRCAELTLGAPVGERLLIDKNPSLTFLVPALIRVFPEIKFLVALRDPRDVCLSCFMQPLPLTQVSSAYLSLADTADEYASLMGVWQTVAPRMRNPRLEVRYEDMVENLEAVSRKSLEFLGVPWDERVLRFDEHARQKLVRSPTYADVAKPVFKRAVARWRHYQKHLEPCLARLEPFVKAFGYE